MTDVARQHLEVDAPIPAGPTEPEGSGRPMRADARRNYERLVVAAREVFAQEGGGASMEAIARRAGVGVGTLYRHFPNRIDLVEAVYRTDVDNLVHTAEQVSADLEPWPAAVAFLEAFVRYAQGKRTFLNELREAFEKSPDLKVDMMDRIRQAMELVVGRAQRAGVMRTDVSGSDLMQLVGPMCTNATLSEDQSKRLLDTILDGLHKDL
jgi:AcrR family transcriptional regulator